MNEIRSMNSSAIAHYKSNDEKVRKLAKRKVQIYFAYCRKRDKY